MACNEFFTSVFTAEDLTSLPVPDPCYLGPNPLSSLTFSRADIERKIKKLKPSSAPGPDLISARILRECVSAVSLPLSIIFAKSLAEGKVPTQWKCANVTPVFKKGLMSLPGNYRLTCIVCKIMESLICDAMNHHLAVNSLLRLSQHGFPSHRSCLTNLLSYLDALTDLLDKGHDIDVFYLDFAKAFDKVPHQRLLAKVRCHGINGEVAQWIEDWLSSRSQRVVLNGVASAWTPVTSGVPQGSVLGPLLFLVFINDIDSAVDLTMVHLLKFADDTKGFSKISSPDDIATFQSALNNLFAWSVEWQMLFNVDKCHILHFGASNPAHVYTMNGVPLTVVHKEKDLGIIISDTAKPSLQVAAATKKANQVLGQLFRCFTYRDSTHFLRLYLQFVRPHLEYAVQAWCPYLRSEIDQLEAVQKRAIRAISGLSGSYEDKLVALGIQSLEARRSRGDAIQVFKTLNQIDNVNPADLFTLSSTTHSHATRSSATIIDGTPHPSLGLVPKISRTQPRREFFTSRAVPIWNALPK